MVTVLVVAVAVAVTVAVVVAVVIAVAVAVVVAVVVVVGNGRPIGLCVFACIANRTFLLTTFLQCKICRQARGEKKPPLI